MEITIKRRGLSPLRFWKKEGDGNYIYVDASSGFRCPGTLGQQITDGHGSCLSSSDEDFNRVCRSWWRRKRGELEREYNRALGSNWR